MRRLKQTVWAIQTALVCAKAVAYTVYYVTVASKLIYINSRQRRCLGDWLEPAVRLLLPYVVDGKLEIDGVIGCGFVRFWQPCHFLTKLARYFLHLLKM